MNKRQMKKKRKKYLPVLADEVPLLLMTSEEQEQALREFSLFRKRYAYRKTYEKLKKCKGLCYFYSAPQKNSDYLKNLFHLSRKYGTPMAATQSLPVKDSEALNSTSTCSLAVKP